MLYFPTYIPDKVIRFICLVGFRQIQRGLVIGHVVSDTQAIIKFPKGYSSTKQFLLCV